VNRRTLDPCNLTRRNFEHLGLEAMALGPTQIHAQQHLGPVLRLGAARTGLEIDVGIIRIELSGEHAPEFEPCNDLFGRLDIAGNFAKQLLVVLGAGELEELGVIRQLALE
jgi:hypothetical protein